MTNVQQLFRKLSNIWETVWRHRLVVFAVFFVCAVLAVVIVSKIPKNYVANANLLVTNGTTRDDPTLQSPDLPTIAVSTVVLHRAQQAAGLTSNVVTMKRHLSVKAPAYKSSILTLAFTDLDPNNAVKSVNAIADQMTKYVSEVSTARFDSDLQALDLELSKQIGKIRWVDSEIRTHGDIAVSVLDEKGADAITGRIASMEYDRGIASAALSGDQSRLRAFDEGSSKRLNVENQEILQNDKTYGDLRTAVATSTASLEEEGAVYTKAFPGLDPLRTKVERLRDSLSAQRARTLSSPEAYSQSAVVFETERRNVAVAVQADTAKVSALDGLLKAQRERLSALPSVELLRLQRNAAQADYLAISSRRATSLANRADALSLGSVVVVDRAIKADRVVDFTGNKLLITLLVLSFVLAFVSAMLADSLDPSLRRAKQIENLYGGPLLGNLGRS